MEATRYFRCQRCGEFRAVTGTQPVTVSVKRPTNFPEALPLQPKVYEFCAGCAERVQREIAQPAPQEAR